MPTTRDADETEGKHNELRVKPSVKCRRPLFRRPFNDWPKRDAKSKESDDESNSNEERRRAKAAKLRSQRKVGSRNADVDKPESECYEEDASDDESEGGGGKREPSTTRGENTTNYKWPNP